MALFTGINWKYIAEKFARDTAAFFIASTAFQQFLDGAGTVDPKALGVALGGAVGTAVYRIIREMGLFGESAT
jgi:hypothetical protein